MIKLATVTVPMRGYKARHCWDCRFQSGGSTWCDLLDAELSHARTGTPYTLRLQKCVDATRRAANLKAEQEGT